MYGCLLFGTLINVVSSLWICILMIEIALLMLGAVIETFALSCMVLILEKSIILG